MNQGRTRQASYSKTENLMFAYRDHDVAACELGQEHKDCWHPLRDGVWESLHHSTQGIHCTMALPDLLNIWGY